MATVGVKGLNVIIDTGRVVRNDAVQSWTWVHFAGSNVRVVLVHIYPIHRIPAAETISLVPYVEICSAF